MHQNILPEMSQLDTYTYTSIYVSQIIVQFNMQRNFCSILYVRAFDSDQTVNYSRKYCTKKMLKYTHLKTNTVHTSSYTPYTEVGGSLSFRENIFLWYFSFWVVILMQNHLTKKIHLVTKNKFHSYIAHFPNKLPIFLDFARYSRRITSKWPS